MAAFVLVHGGWAGGWQCHMVLECEQLDDVILVGHRHKARRHKGHKGQIPRCPLYLGVLEVKS